MSALLILLGVLIYAAMAIGIGRVAGRCIDEMGGPDDE